MYTNFNQSPGRDQVVFLLIHLSHLLTHSSLLSLHHLYSIPSMTTPTRKRCGASNALQDAAPLRKVSTRLQNLTAGPALVAPSTPKATKGSVSLWTKKLFIEEFRESCAKDPSLAPTVVGRRAPYNFSRKQVGDTLFVADDILAKVEEIGEAEAKKRTKLHMRPMQVIEQMLLLVFQQEVANSKVR